MPSDIQLIAWQDHRPDLAKLSTFLSPKEQQRAQRFTQTSDHDRYVIAHGLLYQACAERLAIDPADLQFLTQERGKPYLVDYPLHFNLSHSGDWLLFGFSTEHPIGVDIQQHNQHNFLKLAKRFFHAEEYAYLHAQPGDQLVNSFYTIWTQKEALVKASGQGIQFGLPNFSVWAPPEPFTLKQINAPERYSAAISLDLGC